MVDENEKGATPKKVDCAVNEVRRKAIREDVIPVDLLKELGENGLRKLTRLINRIYKIKEWLK